jgi:signal transduction histidine kinase
MRFALAKQTHAQTGLFVPLRFRGRVLGVLAGFDRLSEGPQFNEADERLLSAFAASAAAAVATAQDVAAQALQRSLAAAEQERTRWARELHDETLQELAALKLMVATARIADDADSRDAQLKRASDRIDIAVRALRNLITDLRPPVLDDDGLAPALAALADRMQSVSGLSVELRVELDDESRQRRLPPQVEDTIYRVIQEALANVVKHAGANQASVDVHEADGTVQLLVHVDGEGFALDEGTTGFGLLGMRERLALVYGEVTIDSVPGKGTTVHASIPTDRGFSAQSAATGSPA